MRNPALFLAALVTIASTPALSAEESWNDLREMLFSDRIIHDGDGIIALDAPNRAHDAAIVPISVTSEIPAADGRWVRKLHVVIDENPSPVAGIFTMSQELGGTEIETRIRVNEYSFVRAIAELSDGELYMSKAFVKAAGGCSAPATKDPEAALARLGKMKFKQSTSKGPEGATQAKLLISHPNYSGLQIDQLTRNWIPPDYINRVEVRLGDHKLLEVESDISLSEDPVISFSMAPQLTGELSVTVDDTNGRHFEQSWQVGPAS